MLGNKLINTNAGGGCTNTVDLYNPFPDGGGLALYQLNGDATDVSGNYDGTASNVTYGAGEFGQAGVFNGNSNSYIFLSSLNSFFLNGGNAQNFSVSLWFKTVNTGIFFSDFQGGYKAIISLTASGNLYVGTRAVAGDFDYITTETYNDGQWHHVVVTISKDSSNNKKVYIDNILKNTSTIPSADGQYVSSGYGNNVSLATFAANGTTYGGHNCSIDQLRIFNRPLRPYEVEALYTEEYCTPTIVPSEHFNTVTWSADGTSGDIDINGVGFQPDFVWAKARTQPYSNALFDSVRGVGSTHMLFSDSANSESTNTPNSSALGFVSSFNVDGFTGGAGTSGNAYYNETGHNYVAWNFKAGGAAVTNTDGTITSQVSANTEAGFSIVTATMGSTFPQTIGHGLGVAPNVILARRRSLSGNWVVYHKDVDATPENYTLFLDTTDAKVLTAFPWNNTAPTDSVFTTGQYFISNETIVAYCFAEVEGFSSFGSYVGNLSSQTNIVTGFEPAFVMIKCSSGFNSGRWNMYDNKRSTTNPNQKVLFADLAGTEGDNLVFGIDFYENGFSIPTTCTSNSVNQTGYTYIYMAFAADPTTVEPTLEDSFNTALFTSTGGSQSITGLGFQPDLLWTKNRTSTWFHQIVDSVRGLPKTLYSNSTQAESTPVSYTSSLDTDGFTVNYTETIGSNYVAWAWKGAELPAINSNGSIPSVVSANPAAGFSIVSYTTQSSGTATVGHGLNAEPNIVLVKTTGVADSWRMYHSSLGAGYQIYLNLTNAAGVTANQWNNTAPTSSVFSLGTDNAGSYTTIAYCFAEVAGFSKFGSYTGTGGSGNTVTLGFEPAFLLIKRTDVSGNSWIIGDNKRDTTNPIELFLAADTSQVEFPITNGIDFNANNFTIDSTNGSLNASGGTYIYMAFANQF